MNLNAHRTYQCLKYVVYGLLVLNIALFLNKELAASAHRFVGGIEFAGIIEGFASTIDTTAWVVLLLMFELETFVLDERHFTRRVTVGLQLVRVICYSFIVYAFYGYVSKLLYLQTAAPLPGVNDLCALATGTWAYAVDLDEYVSILASNCVQLSTASELIRFNGLQAVVDLRGYTEIVRLAWVDVINSAVWLGVVLVLEVDVHLQERNRLEGLFLTVSNFLKYLMYSTLFLAAVYWGIKGDFVDFWDAFLWLVAFVFIELNVVEWRQEGQRAPA